MKGPHMKGKYILAPDSFKGVFTADEVCEIWKDAITAFDKDACVQSFPLADGGEGMTRAFQKVCGGTFTSVQVCGSDGKPIEVEYLTLTDGTVVMEMAACAGLDKVEGKNNPLTATTCGVGEMLLHAQNQGAKKIILGLGGSATNDCGIGMAAAFGYRFLDEKKREIKPSAENLKCVATILPPDKPFKIEVTAACDVDNPLCGLDGATFTFGPQKGITEEQAALLDQAIRHFSGVISRDLNKDIAEMPGAGAAGGLGAAVAAFLDGTLAPGIDLLLDAARFDDLLADAGVVWVGEGRMDWQSAHGKAPVGISRRAKRAGVPCIALNGSLGKGAKKVYEEGMTAIFAATQGAADIQSIRGTAAKDMRMLADSVVRMLNIQS